jgi:hypothetical protein
MTIKSVARLIWMFLHALFTVIGAFFVFYYVLIVIMRHSAGVENADRIAWPLVPAVIFAVIDTCAYTWWKQRRKLRNDHTF